MYTLIFGSVSGLFHKWDLATIDNHIFKLHYRATVIILLSAAALVGGNNNNRLYLNTVLDGQETLSIYMTHDSA